MLDTATIAAGGAANYVVTLDANRQIEALTVDDVFARLTTGANVLTVNGLSHIKNGELGGGTNISGGLFSVLRNSAKIRTTSASTIATATLENEAGANLEVNGATLNVDSATVTNAGTIDVRGGNAQLTTLNLNNGATNTGTINLTNAGPNGSTVSLNAAGGVIDNQGTINVQVGTGGGTRNLGADVSNSAIVNINSNTRFTKAAGTITDTGSFNTAATRAFSMLSGNQKFAQSGGTLANNGSFNMTNGTFDFTGGTLTGNAVDLTNSLLNIGNAAGSGVINLRGTGSTFTGGINAGQTVNILGGSASATTTAANGFTNAGTITLTNQGFASLPVSLNVTNGALTNEGTLNSVVGIGGGARNLGADLRNNGTVNIEADTTYSKAASTVTNAGDFNIAATRSLTMTTGNQTFTQSAGSFDNLGSLAMTNGKFNFNGGTMSGNAPVLTNSTLAIGPGTGAATFDMRGTGSSLTTNVLANQVVNILGGNFANATVTSANDFTNAGTINLTNSGPNGSNVSLNGTNLVNIGTLNSEVGSGGGARNLGLSVTNNGTLNVNEKTSFLGDLVNNGTVNIDEETKFVYVDLVNHGTVNIDKDTVFVSATSLGFHKQIINNGDFNIAATLRVDRAVFNQNGGTLDLGGTLQVSNVTFQYNGGSIIGNAVSLNNSVLAIAPGTGAAAFEIRGVSNTFSGTVNPGQELSIRGGNSAAATLTAANGFTNAGRIELTNTGPNGSAVTLNVNAGSLLNQGELVVLTGIGGGTRALNVTLENAAGGTVFIGQNTALGRAGSVHTNAGEMTLDANLTVAGGSTSFTNLASGLIEGDATLNVSALAGGLLNQGTISPGLSPGILTVQGNYSESATALLAIELGGTTVGTTFDRLAITGNASLAGLLQVTLINGFVPTSSDVFTILTAGTRTGDFANALAQLVTGFGVFDVVYAGNSVSLTNFQPLNVVPEPSTILLSAIGAGAFAIARARRRRA